MILEIRTTDNGFRHIATAEGHDLEEISTLGAETAARRLAEKIFNGGYFYFTRLRRNHYKAEAALEPVQQPPPGLPQPARSQTEFGHEGSGAAPARKAKKVSLKNGTGFRSHTAQLLGGKYLFIASEVPVHIPCRKNPVPIYNRLRLVTEEERPRAFRANGSRAVGVPLFPVNRDNMLIGRVCSMLGYRNPEDLFRLIERAYLRGQLEMQLV